MSTSVDGKISYIRMNINLLELQDRKNTLSTIFNYDSELIKETNRGCIVNFDKIDDDELVDTIYQQIKFKIDRNIS